ncbi:MAG: response regulator transcription factor [Candidatus Latescibacterota bacterium]
MQRLIPTRVLLVDDHPAVRQGLRDLLASEGSVLVVGEAGSASEAEVQVTELEPDVVIMDIGLPDMNGLDATRRLQEARPQVKILVYTMHEGTEYVTEARRAGARGYVLKRAPFAELVRALRAIRRGESAFPVS